TKASGALKSMSSPGGAGNNEIKMADSGGSQGWSLHASKDLNIRVNHDKNDKVGVDESHSVTVNVGVSVGSNDKLSVGGNQGIESLSLEPTETPTLTVTLWLSSTP